MAFFIVPRTLFMCYAMFKQRGIHMHSIPFCPIHVWDWMLNTYVHVREWMIHAIYGTQIFLGTMMWKLSIVTKFTFFRQFVPSLLYTCTAGSSHHWIWDLLLFCCIQLHISDSLHSEAVASSQAPCGIAFIE